MAGDLESLDAVIKAFAKAKTVDKLKDLFSAAIEPWGYRSFDAFSVDPETLLSPDRAGNYVLWSHDYGLLQDFAFRGLADICPVLLETANTLVPFDYLEMLRGAKRNKSAKWQLDLMNELGVKYAWNVPIPGAGRVKGVTVYIGKDVPDAEQRFHQSRHHIHVLSLHLFQALEKLWDAQPGVSTGLTVEPEGEVIKLSPRQKEVLSWCAKGFSAKDIASTIGLSENTVRYHLKETYKKLDASGRSEAVATATRLGLV